MRKSSNSNVIELVEASEPHVTFTSDLSGETYFISEENVYDLLAGDIDVEDVIDEEDRDDLFIAILSSATNGLT